jgi:NAD(P)-dependent dehydrogenase (short-subunit alcohol dehydrogenase family)
VNWLPVRDGRMRGSPSNCKIAQWYRLKQTKRGPARPVLASFAKMFADAYAAKNVRMNNVLPGWIDSLPPTDERRDSVPMEALWRSRRNRRHHCFPAVRWGGLHHRPEHPGGQRTDAVRLINSGNEDLNG